MHIKKSHIFFLLFSLIFLFGCNTTQSTINNDTMTKEALDTVITLTLYSSQLSEDELIEINDKLFNEINRLELIFSATDTNSELYKVNLDAFNEPVKVSKELFNILSLSLEYCKSTEGLFDITLGNLIDTWNIDSPSPKVPDDAQINDYIGRNNWKNVILNEENMTVYFNNSQIKLNLGAVAKGYIAQKIKSMAKDDFSITSAIFNFGGNITTIGKKYNDSFWNVGITDPKDKENIISSVSIDDKSVVTSGNYERYFIYNGIRYHHILDPFTGYPSKNGIISSTIIGPDSGICDILSTACYIAGQKKALEIIEDLPDYECVLIDEDLNIYKSSGLNQNNFR